MQPSAPSQPTPSTGEESAELVRFREEWLAELQHKKNAEVTSVNVKADSSSHSATASTFQDIGSSTQTIPDPPASLPYVSPQSVPHGTTTLPSSLSTALNIYRRAVEHEQRSELDDALDLYRQAFRMDPNVDRAFHRDEASVPIPASHANRVHEAIGDSTTQTGELGITLKQSLSLKSSDGRTPTGVVTGTLASLIVGFPSDVSFEPMVEEPVYLRRLPDELLVMVLRKLSPTFIERFASVSRKARVVTLDSTIWRDLVANTYKPPQVLDIQNVVSLVEKYRSDYRRIYIEQPRVRMDGLYIATCHYVRPGLSENSWVNITHFITYHRYLRFYPNGQVLSLLANEEHIPKEIISLLKPTLRMKGLYIGTWHLSGTTIYLSNLIDASGRFPIPSSFPEPSATNLSDVLSHTRYGFAMTLQLRSRPLGRWNKLNIEAYNSVNLETGDISPVVLKHERPFWFSKVGSYIGN